MARSQCIFLGDEIAAGVYNYMRTNYSYMLNIQYVKASEDKYDTPHFCYDFNRWRWGDNDDVRYSPWYVISTGLHDYDKDYYQDMYEIRKKIRYAREGFFQPAPKVLWIVPGAGTGGQNTVIRNNINRVNSTFGGTDIVLNDIFTWSQNWVPAAFRPDAPSNLAQAYSALGYGAFPYGNPMTSAMVSAHSTIYQQLCVSKTVIEYVTTTVYEQQPFVLGLFASIRGGRGGEITVTKSVPVTKCTPVQKVIPPVLRDLSFQTIAQNTTARNAFTAQLGAAASSLFGTATQMTNGGLGGWSIPDLYSTFAQQMNTATMSVPPYNSRGISYSQFQSLYPNRSYIQEDRTHPTAQGNATLASRILQLTNYFSR